jgi:hypothetical protein
MKVGLETVVSYFPDTVVKREDVAYLDDFVPEGQEAFFKGLVSAGARRPHTLHDY